MNNYIMKPIDLIMLGSPSPFNSSEQTFRVSEKILNPIPFFGALRKKSKNLKIDFISLKSKNKFLLPLPFDIVKTKDSYKYGVLKKAHRESLSNFTDEYQISFGEHKISRDEGAYIDSHMMERYLLNYLTKQDITPILPFRNETRVGIKIDPEKRTAEEGYLYFEEYLRFEKDSVFYLKTDCKLSDKVIKIGGESRMTIVEEINKDVKDEFVNIELIQKKIIENGIFKLILLTPTNAPCEISGAKMIAKIVGRPYVYSGWLRKDIKSFPSRLFRLIKPGAVFYYKIEDEDRESFVKSLFERFWLKPSFFKPDSPYFESIKGENPICLGLTIIGTVKEVKDE